MRVDRFNPAGVIPDNMFVVELRHSLYLFVNVVRLDVLFNRKVNLDLLYRIQVLIQPVPNLKNWTTAPRTQGIKGLKGFGKSSLLQIVSKEIVTHD